jgi:putative N6-adenine-specific DNA methylase
LGQAAGQALDRPPAVLLAGDRSPQALAAARANARRAGLAGQIEFRPGDFFSQPPPDHKGLLVINPPYGPRLGGKTPALASQLGEHLRRCYGGWRYGLVLPSEAWLARLGMVPQGRVLVPHGGEKVYLVWGQVP